MHVCEPGVQEDAARVYDMAIVRDNRKEKTNFPPTMYKEG
jgi:hypothetical protein